uniref:Cystatin domain-containing protein n=1 Tax=Kalanchoe fedtschenkoi TaxID=63787 RepID=A0A7N0UD01_KALFE
MGFGSLISLVLLIWLLVSTGDSARIGGWEEMRDLSNDQHVNEIAEFAVAEINKKADSQLKLLGVIKGQMQVVSGINYKLVVAVQDRDGSGKYEAVVLEKPWLRLKSLTSYQPV